MGEISVFSESSNYEPAETREVRGVSLPWRFGRLSNEHQQAREAAVYFDRSDRGLVLVTGKDRAAWLHNVTTNDIKGLAENRGCYAFAIDVRGRVQFDLNVLCLPDALWLDIDRSTIPAALAHFSRFLITEDAVLTDVSDQMARIGISGPRAPDIASWMGAADPQKWPPLASATLRDGASGLVRHDFAGAPGFELIIPVASAVDWWDRLREAAELLPAGLATLDVLRIEAGIPWLWRDIDDKTIPPETGQVERGISYHKGCYLGQEVIERMRSHGSLAKKITRLELDDAEGLPVPATITQAGAEAGTLTSVARHPREPHWVALGYIKTRIKELTNLTVGDPPRPVRAAG